MHDINIELGEKACVHVHHIEISTQEWKWPSCTPLYREYMKGEEGVWGASAPQKPAE